MIHMNLVSIVNLLLSTYLKLNITYQLATLLLFLHSTRHHICSSWKVISTWNHYLFLS